MVAAPTESLHKADGRNETYPNECTHCISVRSFLTRGKFRGPLQSVPQFPDTHTPENGHSCWLPIRNARAFDKSVGFAAGEFRPTSACQRVVLFVSDTQQRLSLYRNNESEYEKFRGVKVSGTDA